MTVTKSLIYIICTHHAISTFAQTQITHTPKAYLSGVSRLAWLDESAQITTRPGLYGSNYES